MSVADVEAPGEAAVVVSATEDPGSALAAADRDGFLEYHGYVTGDRYQVVVLGRSVDMPAAEVLPLVQRMRAIDGLFAAGVNIHLVELGRAGFVVELDGRRFELADADVIDWCKGFQAGLVAGPGQGHVGVDQLGQIADLIERPSLPDQCRMVILGLMYGGRKQVTFDKLRDMIGALPGVAKPPARKTVVDALGFGAYLSADLSAKMIAAFGLRWTLGGAGRPVEYADGRKLRKALPEMPGMARLRRIVEASRMGWLMYVDRPQPNKARRLLSYRLVVGFDEYVVGVDELDAWLDGLAAYHRQFTAPA